MIVFDKFENGIERPQKCEKIMGYEFEGGFYRCERPAKFYIEDPLMSSDCNGITLLCKRHAKEYDKKHSKNNRVAKLIETKGEEINEKTV